jgi:hypothetical protein
MGGLLHAPTVVDYLGRYSHRIALSDSRLLSFDGESGELAYKHSRDGGQNKTMTLTGEELVRRFLLHVLPKGLMRCSAKMALCGYATSASWPTVAPPAWLRATLEAPPPQAAGTKEQHRPFDGYPCPKCRKGRMQVIARLAPQRRDPGVSTRSPP